MSNKQNFAVFLSFFTLLQFANASDSNVVTTDDEAFHEEAQCVACANVYAYCQEN